MSEKTGSYCNGMSPWKRANFKHVMRNPEETRRGTDEHNSCWDCENIQLAGQFNRRCSKDHSRFIWAGGAENEIENQEWLHGELEEEIAGKTLADRCGDYLICKERRPEHHEVIFLTKKEVENWTPEEKEDFKKKFKVLDNRPRDDGADLTVWDCKHGD